MISEEAFDFYDENERCQARNFQQAGYPSKRCHNKFKYTIAGMRFCERHASAIQNITERNLY